MKKLLVLLAIAVLFGYAWLHRFEPVGAGDAALVFDHWTGHFRPPPEPSPRF